MVCCWWQMVWHSTYGQVQGGNGKWGGPHVIFEIWNLREWGFSLPFLCHLKPKNVLNLSCRMTFPFLPFNIILHFLLPLSLTFFFFEIVRQFALSWTRHSLGSVQPRTCLHFPISLPLSLQLNAYTVVQWLHRVSGHIICGWFITFMSPCVTSIKQFRT